MPRYRKHPHKHQLWLLVGGFTALAACNLPAVGSPPASSTPEPPTPTSSSTPTDAVVEGLVWIVVTLGLSAALLRRKSVAENENREVPGILWLFIALVMTVFGATRLFSLTITDIEQLGSLQIPELFQNIASLIFLIVLAIFLWQLISTYRQRRHA